MPKGIYKRIKPNPSTFKKGHISHWKGKKRPPFSEEWKRKIGTSQKGRQIGKYVSEETKKKISLGKLGHPVSKETKDKISKHFQGEKSKWWKGGISRLPYSVDWTNTLKRSIRERDHYICQIKECGKQQEDMAFDVHHIDYDKLNCNPNNLVTLCRSCHMKTNSNREYWIDYFLTINI